MAFFAHHQAAIRRLNEASPGLPHRLDKASPGLLHHLSNTCTTAANFSGDAYRRRFSARENRIVGRHNLNRSKLKN